MRLPPQLNALRCPYREFNGVKLSIEEWYSATKAPQYDFPDPRDMRGKPTKLRPVSYKGMFRVTVWFYTYFIHNNAPGAVINNQ